MRLIHIVVQNIKFQFRHGFYLVYLVISLSYLAILKILSEEFARKAFVLLIFSDISILGLFFVGAIVFLERDQGIMQTLFVTPLRVSEYIYAQVLSLSTISLIMGLFIGLLRFGLSINLFPFLFAILAASVLATLTGIAIAVKQRKVTSYFVVVTIILLPFFFPVLNYLQITNIPFLQLMPTDPVITLLEGTFSSLSSGNIIMAISVIIVWSIAITIWTLRRFDRYIIRKVGEIQ